MYSTICFSGAPVSCTFAPVLKAYPCFLVLFFCLSFAAVYSQQPVYQPKIYLFKSEEAITLDGELSEASWQKAEKTGTFFCNFPTDTIMARSCTEAMIFYNEKGIYVGAVCHDTFPGDYVVQTLKRDFSYPVSDAFSVVLDPFDDRTNGFSFAVSPLGVQREGLIAGGGNMGVSTDWDNKWFSSVKRYPTYWTSEIFIPFKSIRFKEGKKEWGINFTRNDLKRNESSTWSPVPQVFNIASLAFTGRLIWDEAPVKAGGNVAIIPYILNESTINYADSDPKIKNRLIGGADAKVVLGPLNLDLTLNPDFSQVEVDRQLTNLTRFNLFFPERRNFFIENSDLFASFGFRQIRPFFSRRIGLYNGSLVPIYGGFRLSGKPNKDWRIGLMNMQTAPLRSTNGTILLQPENFTVGAFQRRIFERSFISGIIVHKQITPDASRMFADYNSVFGLDYNLASSNNKWNGKLFYHYNLTPRHLNLSYAHASWLSFTNRNWYLEWNHEYVGKNYDPAVGFVPRNQQFNSETNSMQRISYWRLEDRIAYKWYPASGVINNHGPGVNFDAYFLDSLTNTDLFIQPFYVFNFHNSAQVYLKYTEEFTRLLFDTRIAGIADTLRRGTYRFSYPTFLITTNKRNKTNVIFGGSYGGYLSGTRLNGNIEFNRRIQPYAILALNVSYDRVRIYDSSPYSELVLIGPRLEFTFSKSVFLTTFIQFNTQTRQVNVNSRFQWRFKPMSDLFIVYSDNSSLPMPGENRYLQRMNRGLVVKFVYWFNT